MAVVAFAIAISIHGVIRTYRTLPAEVVMLKLVSTTAISLALSYGPNCLDFGPLAQCFKIRGE